MPDDRSFEPELNKNDPKDKPHEEQNVFSQTGKSPKEMLPFLLSGESDDLSFEFFDKIDRI